MRLIDADALLSHQIEADRMGAMLVVRIGHILRAPTIDTLKPQPDSETGLVPCGVCGKSPTYEEFNDGFFDLDRVECRGCGVMVTSACGKSKAKWNATRGYK